MSDEQKLGESSTPFLIIKFLSNETIIPTTVDRLVSNVSSDCIELMFRELSTKNRAGFRDNTLVITGIDDK